MNKAELNEIKTIRKELSYAQGCNAIVDSVIESLDKIIDNGKQIY